MGRATGDVLLKVRGSKPASLDGGPITLGAAGTTFELRPLFDVPAKPNAGLGASATPSHSWHLARARGLVVEAPWDAARSLRDRARGRGLDVLAAEPDMIFEWPTPDQHSSDGLGAASGPFELQTDQGGRAKGPELIAWHLGDEYSQLRAARDDARRNKSMTVRIAHLDVGYGLTHEVFPSDRLDRALAKNVAGDRRPADDVVDQLRDGGLRNPGHGTGTIGLLAGARFRFDGYQDHGVDYPAFDEPLGAAIDAQIVGVRVADSVVLIKTSGLARAIAYVADLCADEATRVHVLSMSMGGLASDAVAEAVNLAYERGVVLVTAAGNNYSTRPWPGGVPTTSTVYPARFDRVLAACGVMANHKPYYALGRGTMQGNWGPASKAATSLAAYTPNTSWARRSADAIVDMDGAGTSSATPQIAGAAALYIQKHGRTLFDTARYPEPWMRVEAVRHALTASANKSVDRDDLPKYGSGMRRAADALKVAPVEAGTLVPAKEAKVSFAFFRWLTGSGLAAADVDADESLELELAQIAQQWDQEAPGEGGQPSVPTPNPFDEVLRAADAQGGRLTEAQGRQLLRQLAAHPGASARLRGLLRRAMGTPPTQGRTSASPKDDSAVARAFAAPVPFVPETPKYRELHGYALDPSFANTLDTRGISRAIYRVPWDESLAAGPTDEYLQVIDVDPASRCCYEPINLNHPRLLASRGLAPSEGTPQFHQQMVYAVARQTIEHFEQALGRPALWRHGPPPAHANARDDSVYVQRLRIYPHALREANAYYSPDQIALLFGYFNAETGSPDATRQLVFCCLSQDIVAHETTHALLDGMHPRFLANTNADVLAFHEAFADIVALFQRLALPDLLRQQIAETRGEVRTRRSLLGQLATQFGQAVGERGALREAIGGFDADGQWQPSTPDGTEYRSATEPHARGSVLVAAVFDAFMSIYEQRTEDLVRIATDGSGVLRPGALHPDLVERLAAEAAKAASHVLRISIRALDYCPPTDITFGEYLRALITADYEIVPDDDLGYRVAFIEGFRRRGITVCGVRTMSVESLLWRRQDEHLQLSPQLLDRIHQLRPSANAHAFVRDRATIFQWQRALRRDVHAALVEHFKLPDVGPKDAGFFGLDPTRGFEVHSARFAMRIGPDGQLLSQVVIGLLQADARPAIDGTPFEGGATVIADLASSTIRYIIRKGSQSDDRYKRQEAYVATLRNSHPDAYLAADPREPFAALHAPKGS